MPYAEVEPDEIRARIARGEDVFLLDVREPDEVEEWAYPIGVNIPLGQLRDRLDEVPRDVTVVVACHMGGRSATAAQALSDAGWTAENLTGGAVAWAAGEPGQEGWTPRPAARGARRARLGRGGVNATMFVTNHVLSGVVVGRLLERHPVAAFVVGVGSHLALDMVPHWGCEADRALEQRSLPSLRQAGRPVGPGRPRRARSAACPARPAGHRGRHGGRGPPRHGQARAALLRDVSRFPPGSNGSTMRSRTSRRRACRTKSSSGGVLRRGRRGHRPARPSGNPSTRAKGTGRIAPVWSPPDQGPAGEVASINRTSVKRQPDAWKGPPETTNGNR